MAVGNRSLGAVAGEQTFGVVHSNASLELDDACSEALLRGSFEDWDRTLADSRDPYEDFHGPSEDSACADVAGASDKKLK